MATWQIRIDDSWDKYADWVRPRLLNEFDSVTKADMLRLEFGKSLPGDVYTLELRRPDPPQPGYVTATFTARAF
jgi:hypothetical protein